GAGRSAHGPNGWDPVRNRVVVRICRPSSPVETLPASLRSDSGRMAARTQSRSRLGSLPSRYRRRTDLLAHAAETAGQRRQFARAIAWTAPLTYALPGDARDRLSGILGRRNGCRVRVCTFGPLGIGRGRLDLNWYDLVDTTRTVANWADGSRDDAAP